MKGEIYLTQYLVHILLNFTVISAIGCKGLYKGRTFKTPIKEGLYKGRLDSYRRPDSHRWTWYDYTTWIRIEYNTKITKIQHDMDKKNTIRVHKCQNCMNKKNMCQNLYNILNTRW